MQYLIPAASAFLFALLLWFITRRRLGLEYEVVESETFPREKGEGRFFVIKLKNKGNKHLENVKFNITFQSGTIDSVRYSNPNLVKDDIIENSQLSGTIPLINPREVLGITITTIGNKEISSPKIVARAKGVTAVPKKEDSIWNYIIPIILVTGICVGLYKAIDYFPGPSVGTLKMMSIENSNMLENLRVNLNKNLDRMTESAKRSTEEIKTLREEREKGKPDREQIIFGLLNRAGLSHLMPSLISTGEGITYWKTGLFLMHSFLTDKDNSDKYIHAMEQLIAIENVAASSLGFNLYLLGKMEQFIGNSENAIHYFERCRKEAPLMYEHLMAQDPAYDLQKLRKRLLMKANKNP